MHALFAITGMQLSHVWQLFTVKLHIQTFICIYGVQVAQVIYR